MRSDDRTATAAAVRPALRRHLPHRAGTSSTSTSHRTTSRSSRTIRIRHLTMYPKPAGHSGSTGTGTSDPPDDDGTGPPDSAEAFLRPFFTPFRPASVPPCACQGGGLLLDAAAMLPEVTLYLHGHVESLARGDGVVRWEGVGPVTGDYLRTVLGPHARFTVKPVVDPEGVPPADGYEVPTRMAEALHLRTAAASVDVFPFGASTARDKQRTHTVAFDFGTDTPRRGRRGCTTSAG